MLVPKEALTVSPLQISDAAALVMLITGCGFTVTDNVLDGPVTIMPPFSHLRFTVNVVVCALF